LRPPAANGDNYRRSFHPTRLVIDTSQLTWEQPEVVVEREFLVEPKPSPPELALPKFTALPAPESVLNAKNLDGGALDAGRGVRDLEEQEA
jgi:hypothetical protein